jgi:hypothetical protein
MPELHRQNLVRPIDAHREAMTDRPLLSTSGGRLFLFVIRRMAAAGVNDAHASSALLGNFGISYRRPLILMRAMMLELARVSNRKILVGPCCYAGMTDDEARLTRIMAMGQQEPKTAYDELSVMLDSDAVLGALTCAQAVAQSYADLGCPIDFYAAE